MIKQKLIGIALIILSLVVVLMATSGSTTEDRDVTAVLFLLPLGVHLLVSKQRMLHPDLYTVSGSKYRPKAHAGQCKYIHE